MSDDERVLRSFVEDDEQLLGLESVTKADFAKGRLAPMAGEETVAVTDERLLWFTTELKAVPAATVESIEREFVEQQAAPMVVNAGGLLFILGVFGTIGAFLANAGDLMVVAMPAMTGLALFLGTRVFASVTDREGETRSGYRLRLRTSEDTVTVWTDDEATVDRVAAALAESSGVTVVDGDGEPLEDLPEPTQPEPAEGAAATDDESIAEADDDADSGATDGDDDTDADEDTDADDDDSESAAEGDADDADGDAPDGDDDEKDGTDEDA